jgi:hypothetical protein
MAVPPGIYTDVEIRSRVVAEGLKELGQEFHGESPDISVKGRHGYSQVGPAPEVKGNRRKCFVHGQNDPTISFYALGRTKGLLDRKPEADPNILHSVMGVHLEVSFASNLKIKESVSGKQFKHVV